MPTFTSMFASMNIELPWVTVALIGVSTFFQTYGLLLLGLLALLIFCMLPTLSLVLFIRWK